jgi:ribonuclease HI
MTPPPKTHPPASASLFSDAQLAGPPAGVHLANIDGASRGNPGPAAYAVVIRNPEGKIVLELAKKMGRETNNVAEYYALLAALDFAAGHGIRALRVRSDSELLVRQMQGRYKVKSSDLKPLYERASKFARGFQYFAIEHVRREQNRDADALANVALDSGNVLTADPKLSSRESNAEAMPAAVPASPPRIRPPEPLIATAPQESFSRLTLRARVVKGNLVPFEPLDLPEGTAVDLEVRIPHEE